MTENSVHVREKTTEEELRKSFIRKSHGHSIEKLERNNLFASKFFSSHKKIFTGKKMKAMKVMKMMIWIGEIVIIWRVDAESTTISG